MESSLETRILSELSSTYNYFTYSEYHKIMELKPSARDTDALQDKRRKYILSRALPSVL